MVGAGDFTTIFETIGEDAAARGNEKVAGSVDKVRQSWSRGLEQIGKAQSRIALISSGLAAFGLGGLTSESFKRENLKRNAIGDTITGASELVLSGGGALIGGLLGSAIPIIGPIIGSIAGGIIGGLATAILEPFFQSIGEAMKSFRDRLDEDLKEARAADQAAAKATMKSIQQFMLEESTFMENLFNSGRRSEEMTRERLERILKDSKEAYDQRNKELSEMLEPLIGGERSRLAGRRTGLDQMFISDRGPNLRNMMDVYTDSVIRPMMEAEVQKAAQRSEEAFSSRFETAIEIERQEIKRQMDRFNIFTNRMTKP